jgi:hypothetical protein
MRIDLYTKTVLTGILACLLWLCATWAPIETSVSAQLGPTQVVIAGYQDGASTKSIGAGLPVIVISSPSTSAAASTEPSLNTAPSSLTTTPTTATTQPKPSQNASRQCQAITKKGTQCSRTAKPGSNYCWQHGG